MNTKSCPVSSSELASRWLVIAPPFLTARGGGHRGKCDWPRSGWNSRDPDRVALAYTEDSVWRNRSEFVTGRQQIQKFLAGKWERELDYRLAKALWAFTDNRIAVRFQYEWHDVAGQWYPQTMAMNCGGIRNEHRSDAASRGGHRNDDVRHRRNTDRKFFWPAPGPPARRTILANVPDVK